MLFSSNWALFYGIINSREDSIFLTTDLTHRTIKHILQKYFGAMLPVAKLSFLKKAILMKVYKKLSFDLCLPIKSVVRIFSKKPQPFGLREELKNHESSKDIM